jgi:hypothetical protein
MSSQEDDLETLSTWAVENGLEAELPIASNKHFLRYFLRARDGNVDAASEMIRKYLAWRKENDVGHLNFEVVKQQLAMGKICVLPNPTEDGNELVVIFVSRLHYPKDFPTLTFLRSLIFLFEYFMCQEEEYTGYFVLNDLRDVSRSNFDFKVSHVVRSLQACLPLLPRKIAIYKPPFLFKVVWKIVHPFLTPAIVDLIEVVQSDEELKNYVNMENLIVEYGGGLREDRVQWLQHLPGFTALPAAANSEA